MAFGDIFCCSRIVDRWTELWAFYFFSLHSCTLGLLHGTIYSVPPFRMKRFPVAAFLIIATVRIILLSPQMGEVFPLTTYSLQFFLLTRYSFVLMFFEAYMAVQWTWHLFSITDDDFIRVWTLLIRPLSNSSMFDVSFCNQLRFRKSCTWIP